MDSSLANRILDAATSALSATALANAVGKSKGYMIQAELDELVRNGQLECDESGRFPTYKRVAGRVTVRTDSPAAASNNVVEDVTPERISLPAGYVVSKKKFQKLPDGQKVEGRVVTLPNGTKKFLRTGYTLIAINNEEYVSVRNVPAFQQVISNYASRKGMTPYVVRDSVSGTIGNNTPELTGGVVALTVEKMNKAA